MTLIMDPCPRCDDGLLRNACPDCHGEGYVEVEHPEIIDDDKGPDEEISGVVYPASRISGWLQRFRRPRSLGPLPGPEDAP